MSSSGSKPQLAIDVLDEVVADPTTTPWSADDEVTAVRETRSDRPTRWVRVQTEPHRTLPDRVNDNTGHRSHHP
jgi:hypothetical protein